MKRIFAAVLSVCLCLNAYADSYDCFVRGDANGDGALNIADSIVALDYAMGNGGTVNDNLDVIDANDDGSINIADGVYIQSILFSGAVHPVPNFVTGKGTDPTPDNVNILGAGVVDPGDYSGGALSSDWSGDGLALINPSHAPGTVDWPHKDPSTVGGHDQTERRGATWLVATLPEGEQGALGNVLLWDQELSADVSQRQLTVGQIRRACRHGRSSGPGYTLSYAWVWSIEMKSPTSSGKTHVYIEGAHVKVTVILRTMNINPPVLISLKVPLDLGKVGMCVYASSGWLYRVCPSEEYDNDCESGVSSLGLQDEGTNAGVLVINTNDLYNALKDYPLLSNDTRIYVSGLSLLNHDEAPRVYHSTENGDATLIDSVATMLLMSVPSITTTTVEY
jgi:hypothetical protein